MTGYPLSESVFFKRSLAIGLLVGLWAFVPSVLAGLGLYGIVLAYGEQFDRDYVVLLIIVVALCTLVMQPARNIASPLTYRRLSLVAEILGRWLIFLFALLVVGFVTKLTDDYPRRILLTWAIASPLVIIIASLVLQWWMRGLIVSHSNQRRVVFAGCNEVSMSLAQRIETNPELCMSVAGFFDDRGRERLGNPDNVSLIGRLPDLARYVKQNGISVIFVALPIRHLPRVLDLLDDLRDTTASIYYVPDIFVFDLIQARTGEIMGIPVVAMCETPFYGLRGLSKRLFDLIVATLALLLASPLFLLIAILVKLSSPGPAIFRQRRYGLDGEQITVYKFRTMVVTEDGQEIKQATKDDARTTPIGRLLRRSSLDELPQLINVVQGRMSLVGPRPHAVAHNEMYRKLIKGYMVRHKVLPGITGLAQIHGFRGETKNIEQMEARVRYDLEYLRKWSILLDIRILATTAIRLFQDKNAY